MKRVRFLLLPLLLVSAVVLSACGDDDENDDPRASQVGAAAENAVYAWASAGPEALYDYLTSEVQGYCSQDDLADALADQQQPTDFKGMKNVKFVGERAQAQVTLIYGTEEEAQEWLFQQEGDSWRIFDMPGLENCVEP